MHTVQLMMKTSVKILFVTSVFLFLSCAHEDNIFAPTEPALDTETLHELISVELVNYDSLVVKNKGGTQLQEMVITRIEFGEKDTGEFVSALAVTPVYSEANGHYSVSFTIPAKIYNKRLTAFFFTIRFFFEYDIYADVDTFIPTYKYPYLSTEIFLETNEIFPGLVQDFEIIGAKFYFVQLGFAILNEYDLNSGQLKELLIHGSGDHITGTADYLFLDFGHDMVWRYNIQSDSIDLKFDLSSINNRRIRGMQVYKGTLYVLFPV